MKRILPFLIIILVLFGLILGLNTYNYYSQKESPKLLPVFGNKIPHGLDTIYHTISNFSFTNQLGDTITQEDIKDKIFVVEYFFTTCQSICPVMNKNMIKVSEKFKNDRNFKILSHTVRPEEDSVASMLVYAHQHHADSTQWWFLTGDKRKLYSIARTSYMMDNYEGDGGSDDFIHTQLFALIDKQKRIRGYYDGTDTIEVNKLIKDISLLKTEAEPQKQ